MTQHTQTVLELAPVELDQAVREYIERKTDFLSPDDPDGPRTIESFMTIKYESVIPKDHKNPIREKAKVTIWRVVEKDDLEPDGGAPAEDQEDEGDAEGGESAAENP